MSRFGLIAYTSFLTAISFQHANAQYQSFGNPIGSVIGGIMKNILVSQAQNAWNAYDQSIVACINSSGTISVPMLINNGVLPTDARLSPLIQQCQNQIAAQQAQVAQQQQQAAEQQQQAEAAAQQQAQAQAAEQQATELAAQQAAQAQAQQQAQAIADEKLMAQEQAIAIQVSASFVAFKNKTLDPQDHTAPLLNYTSFGSDSGSPNDFWARKNKTDKVYVEYQKGVTIQTPVVILQELDVSKIDPLKLYIQQQSSGITVTFDKQVFSNCKSCSLQTLQSRWISLFQTQNN